MAAAAQNHKQTETTTMQAHIERRGSAPVARQANFFQALILLCTVICGTLAPTVIGPVLPAMQQHFAGVPGIETLVPVVVTMPMFVLGALAIVVGAFSDRVGRKRVLVGALVRRRSISTRFTPFSPAAPWSVSPRRPQ
jgi:MFS family permease